MNVHVAAIQDAPVAVAERAAPRAIWLLLFLFVLSLPFVNPWVRGDGVGYYAYVRSLLINHDLHFEDEWKSGNQSFVMGRVDENGRLRPDQYTRTGYVGNHFSVGSSLLWAPFLTMTHLAVLGVDHLGANVAADGYSRPYVLTMALSTALYGFLGLLLSFDLARKYYPERWALLATLGIWFASSLPVYMYFNPSWSHAQSAFAAALFLWYGHRTREARSLGQWVVLGLISGLMINVYYLNAILLLVPALECVTAYRRAWSTPGHVGPSAGKLLASHATYALVTLAALLPTWITRWLLYGNPFELGYQERWFWTSPALLEVLFSSNHGLFSWTPILALAVLGLVLFWRRDPVFGGYLLATFLVLYYVIASYGNWAGLSSYGNRFFVSLTPLFVLGLAASLERFGRLFSRSRSALAAACVPLGLLAIWNAGFIFQWGTHLVPARGPISWPAMAHNQGAVVPVRVVNTLKTYMLRRKALMQQIEEEDLQQMQSQRPQEN